MAVSDTGDAMPSADSALHDAASRARKARKILAVLTAELGEDLASYICLDVGCSSGLLTKELATRCGWTLGLDLDETSIRRAARSRTNRLQFARANAQRLPIRDASIDIVVCAQVYEHVQDAGALVAEIWRVLRPGGRCFFSGPNRLFPIELHCGLPFVHWLPYHWAKALVRLVRGMNDYDVRSLTMGPLRRLLARFQVVDYTVDMLRAPEEYGCVEEMGRMRWMGRLPEWLLVRLVPLAPNFNWVLTKSEAAASAEGAD